MVTWRQTASSEKARGEGDQILNQDHLSSQASDWQIIIQKSKSIIAIKFWIIDLLGYLLAGL